jgi:hypothetical protein
MGRKFCTSYGHTRGQDVVVEHQHEHDHSQPSEYLRVASPHSENSALTALSQCANCPRDLQLGYAWRPQLAVCPRGHPMDSKTHRCRAGGSDGAVNASTLSCRALAPGSCVTRCTVAMRFAGREDKWTPRLSVR